MNKRLVYSWLPLAVTITLLSGMVYGVTQYQLRAGGNDPQIALAEDGAQKLNSGGNVNDVVPKDQVDIAKDQSTFVIVSDSMGNEQDSSAVFNGKPISPPAGVLAYARQHGQDEVTWQPANGVRIALEVKAFDKGTVSSGRSLHEVEKREDWLMWAVAFGWLVTMLSSLAAILIADRLRKD